MVFSSVAQMRIKEVTFPSQREREMKQVFERFMLLQILSLKFIINKQHVSKLKSRSKKKKKVLHPFYASKQSDLHPSFIHRNVSSSYSLLNVQLKTMKSPRKGNFSKGIQTMVGFLFSLASFVMRGQNRNLFTFQKISIYADIQVFIIGS